MKQVESEMKTTHKKLTFWMVGVSILFYLPLHFCFLEPRYHDVFSYKHYWSFFCVIFLLVWWIIYFGSRGLKIWSLRLFLDERSLFRGGAQQDELTEGDRKRLEEAFINKASLTMTVQGIFIVIVALFLTLVWQTKNQGEYQKFLRPLILITSIATVTLMVFAIDLLDTVANLFKEGDKAPFEYQKRFYEAYGVSGA